MNARFLEMRFTSPVSVGRRMLKRGLQIRANLESAVAETVLLGVTLIAMDTPIRTGRARANIAGEFSDHVDISGPTVDSAEVAAGRSQSPTYLDVANLEGRVGGNVEYLPDLEFGHRVVVKAATGRKYAKRKGGKVMMVPGKAMFRKNIPTIREYFRKRCRLAVKNGLQGKGIGGDS